MQFLLFNILLTLNALNRCSAIKATEESMGSLSKLVDFVNLQNTTWMAGHNFNPDIYTPSNLAFLCGSIGSKQYTNGEVILPTIYHKVDIPIPFLFQSSGHWPFCPTIKQVMDQGSCSSDWAVSAVQTMSDRICIFSQGRIVTELSVQDLLTCCGWRCGEGCRGGYPLAAWNYFQRNGIVTGSGYKDNRYCQPYTFPPCHHFPQENQTMCNETTSTPQCLTSCQGNRSIKYATNKLFAVDSYTVSSKVEQIQMEIFINGPVQATMSVYADFLMYKVGVYQHVTGDFLGEHSVRIVGWGEEQNIRYWTVSNTWNAEWGEKGFFKILREVNECGIESSIVAGRPRIDDDATRIRLENFRTKFFSKDFDKNKETPF